MEGGSLLQDGLCGAHDSDSNLIHAVHQGLVHSIRAQPRRLVICATTEVQGSKLEI